jgi:CBS domain-containing membrane protein
MKPLTVGEVMIRKLITMKPEDDLATLRQRMSEGHIRHIPVVDDRYTLIGLVSHRDLLRATLIQRPGISSYVEDSILAELQLQDIMITELEVTTAESDLRDAARLMLKEKYGCLPVVEGDRLVGILTEADFLRVFLYED